jgi:hypothetical protein
MPPKWVAPSAPFSTATDTLRLALSQKPKLIYLLTDGAFDDNDLVVAELRKMNAAKKTRINTIAFFSPDAPPSDRKACEDVGPRSRHRERNKEMQWQTKEKPTRDATRGTSASKARHASDRTKRYRSRRLHPHRLRRQRNQIRSFNEQGSSQEDRRRPSD